MASSKALGALSVRFINDYRNGNLSPWSVYNIHRKGFAVADWMTSGLSSDNFPTYLSTASYYGMHPLNGLYSKWIDDKLTLKYLMAGTSVDYMPKYYYLINEKGECLPLVDCAFSCQTASFDDITAQLKREGNLAFKRVAGSFGEGFYRAKWAGNLILFNGEKLSESDFSIKIVTLRNYLVTEYLSPHKDIAKHCPHTVNCIRYLAGRVGGELTMLKGFIRFGTKMSGYVENYNAGGVLCYIDETGHYDGGNLFDSKSGKNTKIMRHPDAGTLLCGTIPQWETILQQVQSIGEYFPQLDYLGIDFVVTEKDTVKILEINSLTSLDALQIDESILRYPPAENFFRERLRSQLRIIGRKHALKNLERSCKGISIEPFCIVQSDGFQKMHLMYIHFN